MSRPRFWSYLFGPFIIGYAIGTKSISEFSDPLFWVVFAFFILPANVLLYGINDYFDTETDKYSSKKKGKEILNHASYTQTLVKSICCALICAMLVFLILPSFIARTYLAVFVLLAIAYSAPPFRFKKRVVIDFLANVLYLTPAFVGMFMGGVVTFNYSLILSAVFWVFAMHLFSAIPDISADTTARIRTSAVYFGQRMSLALCLLFWGISYLLLLSSDISTVLRFTGIIYPLLAAIPLTFIRTDLNKLYWLFPAINTVSGMIIFFELLY